MKMLLNLSRVIMVFLVAIFVQACIEETDEVPKVVAGFTFTVTESGTVTFLNTSERATKYSWAFGDGETSTEINPIKSYTAGIYIVSLTASNAAGASDIFKDTLNIIIKDKVSLPITFDDTNVDYKVTTFNGASFAIVDNPSESGTNNKATKVGAITNSGVAYEGIFIDVETQIDLATEKTIAMNFRASAPVNVLLKLEEGTSGAIETTAAHTGTGWEKLSFNFTSSAKYSRLTLFVDGPGTTAGTFEFDDVDQEVTPAPTAPTTPAPTPPARSVGDVISIFSGAYANISGVDTNPNWGQATVTTTIDIAGNATLKYENLNYQGTDWSGNAQNVSAMGFLHVDFWTANSTALNVSIISAGPLEKAKALTVPTAGNWTSVDIPLTDFAPPVNLSSVIQLKFDGNGTIFLDNLYFYKTAGAATEPSVAAPTPPARAAGDVISIFSGAYTNISGVDTNPNWGQSTVTTTINVAGNPTLKYAGLNYQGTDWAGNAQDVSSMTHLHVDFWTANSTALNVSVISAGPQEKAKALTVPTGGNWTSIDIPLTDFAPPVNLTNVIQFKFDGNGDIFLDNLYFYKPAGGGGGTNIAANGTFETGTDSGWIRFQNGGTAVLDNTLSNGGSWSGKLATGGPSNPAFKQERIGVGTVAAGKTVQISFDHKGSVVQPGAVFNVILFGEGASGASFTHVFSPAPIPGTNWTTFTGSFAIPGGADVSQGVSFLIEAVCGGDVGCSVTANIDNVTVTVN